TTVKLADGAVTTAKLDADAVTNAQLADSAVQTENILSGGNDKVLVTDASGIVNWSDKSSLDQVASQVAFTPVGNTSSTDVQAAIEELQTDIDGFAAIAGQTNTASNVGNGGVGIFARKTGADLEFKNLNAGSNKVTITDDSGNDEVDIDINEANLTITESQISDLSHTVDTDNQNLQNFEVNGTNLEISIEDGNTVSVPIADIAAKGNGIKSTVDNGDGTFTLTYDDNTAFTTSDLTGPQGPIGLTGPQGPAGADGVDGADGADGAQGPKGDKGDTGAQGPQGPIGLTGPQGPAGADGADGADGAVGPQGPKGDKGDTGAQGPQGPIGLTGPQGPAGADGVDGADGADGAVGPQGPQGPKGDKGDKGDAGA
ncbi:collagen-like protein, partial [Flavobacteriaceae bacterium F89]|nr:collagen-like protein [Cerina litoralis]